MKTNMFKPVILLLCLGGFMTIQSQGLYNLATLDDEYDDSPLKFNAGTTFDDVNDAFDDGVEWADFTAGGSVGFGWSDNDGNSETSYCLALEALWKLYGEDKNPNGAGYAGPFGSYHKTSSDGVDESLLRAGVKFSYFDRISALNEVQLIYGVKAFLETGSRDFSGFKEDVTGYGATAFTGVNFKLNNKVSVGVEVPVLSYINRTFKANGSEFKSDSFSAAINKDNPIMATMRFNLGSKKVTLTEEEMSTF